MNNDGGYVHSEHGTVRFMNGQFYDANWRIIYIPLNNHDFRKFGTLIDAAEARYGGRALTSEELDLIMEEVSNVGGPVIG